MKTNIALAVALVGEATGSKPFKAPKGLDVHGFSIGKGHPAKRLQSLNKSMCIWLQKYSPKRYNNRCDRMTGMYERFYESFSRDDCGFYNPDIKNGGPNPDPSMKGMRIPKNPKSRRVMRERIVRGRRSDKNESSDPITEYYADIEYDDSTSEMTAEDIEYLEECEGNETGFLAELCSKDDGAIMKSHAANANKKLKKVLATTIKWCRRYISECHGQRVNQHCETRALSLYEKFSLKD